MVVCFSDCAFNIFFLRFFKRKLLTVWIFETCDLLINYKCLISTTAMFVTIKLNSVVIYGENLPPIKSQDSLITWLTRSHITNWKKLFFTFTLTLLDGVVTYEENLTHQIIWRHARSCEVMWQIKKFMFSLLEDLSPPNFTELWLTMRKSNQ